LTFGHGSWIARGACFYRWRAITIDNMPRLTLFKGYDAVKTFYSASSHSGGELYWNTRCDRVQA
jgi:hypothetical protein